MIFCLYSSATLDKFCLSPYHGRMQSNELTAEFKTVPSVKIPPEQQLACLKMLAAGKSWKAVATELGMDELYLLRFRDANPAFKAEASHAIEQGLHAMADSLIDIADQYADPIKARLKSDNIKWFLSKRLHRVYGDKLDVNIEQSVSIQAALDAANQRVLRPIRDLENVQDAQVIDLKDIYDAELTDNKSVEPKSEDGGSETLDDLLG